MSRDDDDRWQADAGLDEGRGVSSAEKPSHNVMITRLRKYQGRLPADFKFDRDEANKR